MSADPELRIGGQWLSMICNWDSLVWSSRWPGGDWEATWNIHVPNGWRHWALDDSVTDVEVMVGGRRAWLGDMFEVDWETGQCVAFGRHRQASNFSALVYNAVDLRIEPTGNLNDAYDVATGVTATAGMPDSHEVMQGIRDFDIGVVMDTPENPATIAALIELAGNSGYGTPIMGPDGVLRFRADPTTPTLHIHPDVVDLGYADDEYASSIVVHWISDGTYLGEPAGTHFITIRTDDEMHARKPVEHVADITAVGQIPLATAETIGDTILAKALVPGWTADIPLTPLTGVDKGGNPLDPWTVRADNTLLRVHGSRHPKWPHPYVDIIPGEITVNASARTAVAKPLGKTRRSISEIIEDVVKAGPVAA